MRSFVLLMALMAGGQDVARNTLITAQPTTLLGGVTVNVPGVVNQQSRIPNNANVFEITVTLSEADKLSDDLSITIGQYVSDDSGATWKFLSGTIWHSYGPGGFTVTDPDGTVKVNPDPLMRIGVQPYRGWHGRLVVLPNRVVTAGGTLAVF